MWCTPEFTQRIENVLKDGFLGKENLVISKNLE